MAHLKVSNLFLYSVLTLTIVKVEKLGFSGFKNYKNLIESPLATIKDHDYVELVKWAKLQEFPLFVVPPEAPLFFGFRYFAAKSVWGTINDINQLAYTPDFYLKAYERLKILGMQIEGPHQMTFLYNLCHLSQQVELTSFPVVLMADTPSGCTNDYLALFENDSYKVVIKK